MVKNKKANIKGNKKLIEKVYMKEYEKANVTLNMKDNEIEG